MEEKEIKAKIKEFTTKYFTYRLTDPKISTKTMQELEKLGAYHPPYANDRAKRAIKITALLDSPEEEIKQIVSQEIQNYFAADNSEQTITLLNKIKTYHTNLKERMRKIKEAKANKKYE